MKIVKNRRRYVNAGRVSRKKQFGIKAARVGKTKMVKVLQGNYGCGWEDLCEYEANETSEVRADLKAYRENELGVPFRVIQRRISNPNYAEPVAESTSVKKKYTVKSSKSVKRRKRVMASDEDGYSPDDNERFERVQFAEKLIQELEEEYSFKITNNAYGEIMDIAEDLSFGADAYKHGSNPMLVLEFSIYDIIEEEMGIVIGSTAVLGAQRINVSEWENNYEPDEFSTDPDGLGFEQNRAISLVDEILDDWQSRTPTQLDKPIIDEVYELAFTEPKSCQELADEAYAILEEAYPELIEASAATNNNAPNTHNADIKHDAEYLNALGKGVVKDLTQFIGDPTVRNGDFIYEISDSAITFMTSGDGTVLYIQPLDQIEPNMGDLEADIEELSGAIYNVVGFGRIVNALCRILFKCSLLLLFESFSKDTKQALRFQMISLTVKPQLQNQSSFKKTCIGNSTINY